MFKSNTFSVKNIQFFSNSKVNNGNMSEELDRYQISTVIKATAISNVVKDVTIGPNCTWTMASENGNYMTDSRHVSPLRRSPVLNDNRRHSNSCLKHTPNQSNTISVPSKLESTDASARSQRKLLFELDQQRQLELKEKMQIRLINMEELARAQRLEIISQQENLQRENQARILQEEQQILLQLQEEELLGNRRQEQLAHEHQQHAMRVHELNLRIKEAEQKQKEAEERQKEVEEEELRRMKEKKIQLDKIHQFQMDYRAKYQKIHDIVKSCKDKQALIPRVSTQASKLKSLNEAMDQLVKQCKVGEVSSLDLQTASAIVQQLESVSTFIQDEVGNVNEQHDKAAVESPAAKEEVKPVPEVGQNAVAQPSASVAAPLPQKTEYRITELSDIVDKEALKTYTAIKQFSQEFQISYGDLVKDDRMKKFRFDCQKAVNIPVNAISPVNAAHLQDKLIKLFRLLSGQPVEVGSGHFTASAHPQGIAFCKDLLAKKFVSQGELTVSSKPEAAFAIAAVIVALWIDFPDFGQLLMSHFHNECPYLVPIFLPQLEGQSNEEYYRSLGYNYTESGEVEKQDKFLKRMSGIMRLYAAIIVTRPRQSQNKPHPHGLWQAWRWMACMMNMDPRPDICASLLYDFLEVTGSTMFMHYGQQFQKLLHLICKEYYPKIEKITLSGSGGPVTRLELFLQKILKQGRIPPPVGFLPLNFW